MLKNNLFIFVLVCIVVVSCSNSNKRNDDTTYSNSHKTSSNSSRWIDTLITRVANNDINIYDPDIFLKNLINDTLRINELLKYSTENKNFSARSFALNLLGKNRRLNSDYSMSIQFHKQAYQAALLANNDYLEAQSLNLMGVVYRRRSAIKTALEYYNRALRVAEGSTNSDNYMQKSIAISTEGIGGLYRALGQYEEAILFYKKSLHYEEQLNSLLGMSINHHNIGKTYGLMGEYNSALYHHNQSLEYNNKMNSVFGMAICYNSLGNIAMQQNQIDKAYNYFVPALQMAKQVSDSTYIINSCSNLGWYHLKKQNIDSTLFYLNTAIGIAKRIGYKAALLQNYNKLAELEQLQGNYQKAIEYFKISDTYSNEIATEKNKQYIADITILHDIENHKRTIDQLEHDAVLNKKMQTSKNIVIALLTLVAGILIFLIFQKLQAGKKNKIIHKQKENMLNMQLKLKALQNENLTAENKQREAEKQMLQRELKTKEMARRNEIKAMQNEIDHKNRELATAAAYAIKKNESTYALLNSIGKIKKNANDTSILDKLKKEIENQIDTEADWENFCLHFEEVHPNYFKKLKEKQTDLTKNELRLCSYLIMNLSDKEIALLSFSSPGTIQKAKYRLKKKFRLSANEKLFDYLLEI
ncbi:tetratricopeptide repeat protein [uncultured Draconibacterium sp.]|uniref:tetratricopeptide repeat protein n=1 Tax=uncultured Draconibacterium sp. TaxID=1573823 RepID=UPI0029C6BF8F|nr:tetratricopeptide repeat protein [uncultured Draconibacterium sp.]